MAAIDYLLLLLPPLTTLLHLLASPYSKVEESFSLQATHDILHHGLPTNKSQSELLESYDHLSFPGAVPRSFVGPLVLATASKPFVTLFDGYVNDQFIVRAVLGIITGLSLSLYAHSLRKAHGATVSRFYLLFQLSQFHIPYYASRTLPNTFALAISTAAEAILLPKPTASRSLQYIYYYLGLALFTFAGIVFRGELAILLIYHVLRLHFRRGVNPLTLIPAGVLGVVSGLAATLSVDSLFWQSHLPNPLFSTPYLTSKFGLIWPELSGVIFNAIEGNASDWGVHVWHYYFTNAVPKLLLNPASVITIITAIIMQKKASAELLLPGMWFITTYSFLDHKEWRFIVYAIPSLTALSAVGAAYLFTRRAKQRLYQLLSLGILASIPATFLVSMGMLGISSLNYSGGHALSAVHSHLPQKGAVRIFLDVPTCMTGATRFLQDAPLYPPSGWKSNPDIVWDKTENSTQLLDPAFWEGVDYAVVADPARTIGAFEILEAVPGFSRVRLYKPGERVHVDAVSEAQLVAEKDGLAGEDVGEEKNGIVMRMLKDGFGARKLLRGYWIGIERKYLSFVLQQTR